MRLLRPALLLALGLVATLAAATAARADGAVKSPVSRVVTTPIPFGANCGSFNILFTVDFEGTNITFYDDQGNLTRQIRHGSFTGMLYNSTDLSKSAPYDGNFNRTFDAAANTITLEGLRFQVQLPGQGTVAIDAGRQVIDTLTGETVSQSGQGQTAFNAEVCSLLA
jgi:hypothetical protein